MSAVRATQTPSRTFAKRRVASSSAEEKIRIVLQSLHGEETIAEPTGHRLEAARTRVRRQDVGVLHTTAASLVVMGAARFHDGDALLQQLIHVQSLGLQRLAPRGHILG
jgi:hypothetical protein